MEGSLPLVGKIGLTRTVTVYETNRLSAGRPNRKPIRLAQSTIAQRYFLCLVPSVYHALLLNKVVGRTADGVGMDAASRTVTCMTDLEGGNVTDLAWRT